LSDYRVLVKAIKSQVTAWLAALFGRGTCYKLIKYQGTNWNLSISGNANNVVTVDLKELTRQIQEITPATNHAKLLDDYQFLLCKEIVQWADDVAYVKNIRNFRLVASAYIMRLSEILEQIKTDMTNKGLKRELVRISKKMSHLIDILERSILGDRL
jgi:hypothetical protein